MLDSATEGPDASKIDIMYSLSKVMMESDKWFLTLVVSIFAELFQLDFYGSCSTD